MIKYILFFIFYVPVAQMIVAQQNAAYINSTEIVHAMPEFRDMNAAVEQRKKEAQNKVEGMYADYEQKQKKLQALSNDKSTPDELLQAKIQELQDLQKSITGYEQTANTDLQDYQDKLVKPLNEKYLKEVSAVAKANGYSFILDIESGVVAYYPEKDDNITGATAQKLGAAGNSGNYSAQIIHSDNQKLGYINSLEILQAMPEFKQMNSDIEKQKNSYQKALEGMYADYERKQKDLQVLSNDKSTPDALLESKIQELQDLQKRIEDFQSRANDDLQKLQQEKLKPLNEKYLKSVKLVSIANGYSFILDIVLGVVVHHPENQDDITGETAKNLGLSLSAGPGPLLHSTNQKMAFINSADVLQAMPEFKEMNLDLERQKASYQKALEGMNADYEAKQKVLKNLSSDKSTANQLIESKIQELQDLQKRIQDFEIKVDEDLHKIQQEKQKPINEKYLKAAHEVAGKEGIAWILDISTGAVASYDETLLLNDKVKNALH